MWSVFKKQNKTYNLGIDIGTSSIKMVELLHDGNNIKLNNYAQFFAKGDYISTHSGSFNILDSQIANVLQGMYSGAGFVAKRATMALPVFSSFATLIDLPSMGDDELQDAVQYEVRKYIPVPIGEVQFDWMKVDSISNPQKFKVLTVAVPNEIVNRYNKLSKMINIELTTMELETFSNARALIPANNQDVLAVLDIGSGTTTISVVDRSIVVMHHNIGYGGASATRTIARGMSIDMERAEELKKKDGMKSSDSNALELIRTSLDKILTESQQVLDNYVQEGGQRASKLILSGGTALMPGLVEYAKEVLRIDVEIGNPFRAVEIPSSLKNMLGVNSPDFSVAVGLALRK